MLVGSFLDPRDLRVCTTQLCSSGAAFVANLFTNNTTTVLLHQLVALCRSSAGVDDIAIESIKRIESFVKRRGEVQTIILDAKLYDRYATNANVYSDIHRCFQQGSSFRLSQNRGITVEWHVSAEYIPQVEFLLKVDVPKDGAVVSASSAVGAIRQYLHTLDLNCAVVSDVSVRLVCLCTR
jgi:outer membrane receptor for monomeric catechols